MGLMLLARDVGSDIDGVRTTFSSWDGCMSKAYCKWPVIIGIVIGALIILSLISCLVRCLCCGVECCCGCLSCCNACCPSPRRRQGYQQQPPPPPTPYQQYPMYNQYQQPQQPPVYGSGGLGYRSGPQTATFDMPSRNRSGPAASHADTLPAMPTWDSARTHRIEDDEEMEDVEMEKLVSRPPPPQSPQPSWQQQQQQQQPRPLYAGTVSRSNPTSPHPYHTQEDQAFAFGANDPRTPHTDAYADGRRPAYPYQSTPSQTAYSQTYRSIPANPYALASQQPSQYHYQHQHQQQQQPSHYQQDYPRQQPQQYAQEYAAYGSNAAASPPSPYASTPPPTSAAAAATRPPSGLQIGRRPVQGSWREV